MGKSGKLFKALVAGVKAFKSPSKEKPEKDKSASKADKDHLKKGNKEKCLWSLGKSSSRNRDSLAAAAAFLDPPEIKSTQVENKHVKDVPTTVTTKTGYGPKGLVKAEDPSFTGHDPMELVEKEELAAIKIQTAYRRHLASQCVFRALRAVVRLQALARGRMVRKQACAALRCMQALVKVQALARGRRVRASELGQLIQKHLQQTRQQRKKPSEGWVNSMATVQQLQAKAQSKQDAVVKRQRALVYAFSEQLNRCTPKQNPSSVIDFQPDKSDWGWVWLERWMAAHPWGNPPGVAREQHNKEEMVKDKADVEVNFESYDKDGLSLTEPVGNSNIESTSSTEFVDNSLSHSQGSPSAIEKETMFSVVKIKEEPMHTLTDVERAKPQDKSGIETSVINSAIQKAALRSLPSPPPPPPPPPLYAKRAKPVVAHQTSSHKGEQAAILANTCTEMSVVFEVPHLTSSARAAELLGETCTNTLASHLKSSCAIKPASPDLPCSPVKDSMPFTTAHFPIEAQSTPQSYPNSPVHYTQSTPTTSSITPGTGKVLHAECDMANVSIPMPLPNASDSAPASPSQRPSSPTLFSEVLVLPPQKHAIACSPLSIPDVTYDDDMSNGAHTPEENEITFNEDNTTLVVEPLNGFDEGEVNVNLAACGSMDLKNDLVEVGMDVEEPKSIDFKSDEVIQADSFSEVKGGVDAFVLSAGEKSTEVSPSKHTSPVSKQGQHTEAVSPSIPNYMTTTKSSKAKIRTITSPAQKSDSPKQKMESPRPRFDASKQKVDSPRLKLESPKQKLDSPKQKLDSPKQKLDSPKQKPDIATKRRHSLSALEGKGSPGTSKSTLHVRASSKGQLASLKDTCTENSPRLNGDSRSRHGKPVAA